MAITLHIYYSGAPGQARAFAKAMMETGLVDRIRAEEGNLQYEYFFPLEDENTVLLIDRWENQQAIDFHHATPMMQQIIHLRDKYDLHMRVERYASDGNGLPDKDAAFVRQ